MYLNFKSYFLTGLAAILRSGGTRSGEARMEASWFTTQVSPFMSEVDFYVREENQVTFTPM